MPIKKYRAVNLRRPLFLMPHFRSYELPDDVHRDQIEVAHREHGRVTVRHSMAETCECCAALQAGIMGNNSKGLNEKNDHLL